MNSTSSTHVVKYTPKIPFFLNVTVVKCNNLPYTHSLTKVLKRETSSSIHRASSTAYYVVVKLDESEERTTVSKKGNKSPFWEEQFKFNATTSSTLQVAVYCAHPGSSKEDHVICETRKVVQIGEIVCQNEDVIYALDVVHPGSSQEKDRTISLRFEVDSLAILSTTGGNNTIVEPLTPGPEFQKISERWRRFLASLQSFCLVAKDMAEIDSKAKVAVIAVTVVLKIINDQIARDDNIGNLACTLTELYDWLRDSGSLDKIRCFEKTVKKLLNQTTECAYFIRKYYETYSFVQRAMANIVSEVDPTIIQYQSVFGQLRIELILGTSLQTNLVSVQILEKVTNIEIKTYLNDFPCLERIAFDPDHAAMRGTHCDPVIDSILNWATGNEKVTKHVFLLLGPARSGKSSIAHSIAYHFREEGRLGCGIFLHNGIGSRTSQRISGTIIRHLAEFHPAIKEKMGEPIRDSDIAQADIGRQFNELVVTPLEKLEMVGPVLVIIDGLDGCEVVEDCSRVLAIFKNESLMTRLPPNFRFLITLRPKRDIQYTFMQLNHVFHHTLPNPEKNEALIQKILKNLVPALDGYEIEKMRHEFLRRAGGDEIWTSIVCKAVKHLCIQTDLIRFTDILLAKPLPMTLQDSIMQLLTSISEASNSNFCALLPSVEIFHQPLPFGTDYIPTNEMHCTDCTPYAERIIYSVAEACLDKMNGLLRHNNDIHGLLTTFTPDIGLNDLTRLIKKHIPKDLQYAVMNWMAYILEIQHLTDTLMNKLHELLSEHLLHWIEVLSVIGQFDGQSMCASLQLLDEHISNHRSHSELCRIIKNAIWLLRSYESTISQAPLHIYISALLLLTPNTLLNQPYVREVVGDKPQIFIPRRDIVLSIMLSPNGSQLVNCRKDQTVCICDGTTSEEVHRMKGQSKEVYCAVFSPDGKRVASCGRDETIHVWDVQTGRLLNKLTHKYVHWMEFSLDGSKLLSRSENDTIMWKLDTVDVIGKRRIRSFYSSATFSPNGQVATTSYKEILIFDSKFEHQIATLNGHKNDVKRVAWSVDGSKLASSSKTETLLWDAKQMSLITILNANTDDIFSLRFTANQLSLITNIFGYPHPHFTIILHTWDLDTPNYICITKSITHQNITSADVRLDLRRVVAGTYDGDILMWHIDSLPTLSPKDIDNLRKPHTITFHEPFNALISAHHIDREGWVCAEDGRKIVWVSKYRLAYTIKRSIGKLEFLDFKDETRLVIECPSIK